MPRIQPSGPSWSRGNPTKLMSVRLGPSAYGLVGIHRSSADAQDATSFSGRIRKRAGVADDPFHATAAAAAANHPPQKRPVAGVLPGPSLAARQICDRTPKTPFLALQDLSREQGKAPVSTSMSALFVGPSQDLGGRRKESTHRPWDFPSVVWSVCTSHAGL